MLSPTNHSALGIKNVTIIEGDFDDTLPSFLKTQNALGLVFFDGNHRKDATLKYFHQCLEKANDESIFIFDDIHWSKEMEEAWEHIKQSSQVTLTIDLFFIGLVFFRKNFKAKQDFILRF